MSDTALPGARPSRRGFRFFAWRNRLARSRAFQSFAARTPVLRGIAKSEGAALFDLVAGFCHSQVLRAVVELGLLDILLEEARTPAALARMARLSEDRMALLLRAATALGLTETARGGAYRTSRRGAALLGVPGLPEMIRHHDILYRDLADPVAFLRGETEPALAAFWPYVFGAGGAAEPDVKARYSALMADSQALVAEETLRTVSFSGCRHLMDVGGGTGVFLSAVLSDYPSLAGTLVDLPGVAEAARARFDTAGQGGRVRLASADFRTDPLPGGADAVSLVRVLYDHSDETVAALLAKVHSALPPGGRLVVSEPMSGGARPERAGDAYFALYCAAMGTGRARSRAEIAAHLGQAGFDKIEAPTVRRPFVTGIVTARKTV
ncbi:MAG: methyltransferase [Paracoccaceae bacterium]|nr:methyltransferase [Paracoccaceae bacterium]